MSKVHQYGDPIILNQIRVSMEDRRRRGGGYATAEIRELVQTARERGCSIRDIANAAKVTTRTIVNWTSKKRCFGRKRLAPVELKLVRPASQRAVDGLNPGLDSPLDQGHGPVARVRFPTGVVLEVPVDSLNAHLFSLFGGKSS